MTIMFFKTLVVMSHNFVVKHDITKYVEINIADVIAKYFKVNLLLIHVSTPIGVQEKESIISVKY